MSPHVMTLEGVNIGNGFGNFREDHLVSPPVVTFPPAGSPLAPHAAIVGPTRVAPIVYGPGGTPIMYRRRYPSRGPVCDYCDTDYFAMNGGASVIPYRTQNGFGSSYVDQQSPTMAGVMAVGGSLVIGTALSLFGVWLYNRSGEKKSSSSSEKKAARW